MQNCHIMKKSSSECSILRENKIWTAHNIWVSSLKKEADETLFLELALRGYDLSKPIRENETTAEIVKISMWESTGIYMTKIDITKLNEISDEDIEQYVIEFTTAMENPAEIATETLSIAQRY